LVIELRALNVPQQYGTPATMAGFFDLPTNAMQFRQAFKSLFSSANGQPEGMYITINPLHPDLLARLNNRMKKQGRPSDCATDADVLHRRYILIDVDPKRRARISATDIEKACARLVFDGIRDDLRGRGWGEPALVIDSGNGFHGWYPIELPRDDDKKIERFIKWLAARHNTPAAGLDTSVFNPGRITRLPGSWNRKGDSTPDRPHRLVTTLETEPWNAASSPLL
jgi:hypothetical protein